MASTAVLRADGTTGTGTRVEGSPRSVSARPQRHLRALPPVPAAYAATPVRRGAGPVLAAGAARDLAPAPGLRLTARGRRLVVVLLLAAGVGLAALVDSLLGGEGGGLALMGTSSVTVERGDTLWSIAGSVAGDRDVREVVDRIQELNGLVSADIEPGQVLHLP